MCDVPSSKNCPVPQRQQRYVYFWAQEDANLDDQDAIHRPAAKARGESSGRSGRRKPQTNARPQGCGPSVSATSLSSVTTSTAHCSSLSEAPPLIPMAPA
jgi:hypothetical protein